MGDRTAIAVEIGGKLPAAALEELVEAINDDALYTDWTGGDVDEDWLTDQAKAGGVLMLMNNETYADLDYLPAVCKKYGLSWRMCWDAYPGSYNAGGQLQDAEGFTEYECDGTDGNVLLGAADIRKLGPDGVAARLERLQRPLPAFELVDDDQADAPPVVELAADRPPCIAEVERQWRVVWVIDEFATDAVNAAIQAFNRLRTTDLRQPDSCGVFLVSEALGEGQFAPSMTVDLSAPANLGADSEGEDHD